MNEYEMMTVFHPRLNADETTAAVSALEEQVVANGGEMLSTDVWGRRRLAYPIDGVVDGTYVLYTFKMPAAGTAPLERWIKLSESAIRHLLIRGIIPFEGDRGRDRDDRDRDDRGERRDDDERGAAESGEPRAEAAAPADTTPAATEAADAPAAETSSEDSAQPAAEATGGEQPSEGESSENESSDDED